MGSPGMHPLASLSVSTRLLLLPVPFVFRQSSGRTVVGLFCSIAEMKAEEVSAF